MPIAEYTNKNFQKVEEKNIINTHLSESLYRLPPSFSINVDPEDLL
jgi:hypothetical protein